MPNYFHIFMPPIHIQKETMRIQSKEKKTKKKSMFNVIWPHTFATHSHHIKPKYISHTVDICTQSNDNTFWWLVFWTALPELKTSIRSVRAGLFSLLCNCYYVGRICVKLLDIAFGMHAQSSYIQNRIFELN